MSDSPAFQLWVGRMAFVLLAAAVVFVRLLPLGTAPGDTPGPDLLLCLTIAWVLRRPDQAPPLLIAGVFLLCDLVFFRPPGLWTLIVLAMTELLRTRLGFVRELPFAVEWAMVAAAVLSATLVEGLVLAVFAVPGADLGVALLHSLVTLVTYPAVVAMLWLGLGLRRPAPGEEDALGTRP